YPPSWTPGRKMRWYSAIAGGRGVRGPSVSTDAPRPRSEVESPIDARSGPGVVEPAAKPAASAEASVAAAAATKSSRRASPRRPPRCPGRPLGTPRPGEHRPRDSGSERRQPAAPRSRPSTAPVLDQSRRGGEAALRRDGARRLLQPRLGERRRLLAPRRALLRLERAALLVGGREPALVVSRHRRA